MNFVSVLVFLVVSGIGAVAFLRTGAWQIPTLFLPLAIVCSFAPRVLDQWERGIVLRLGRFRRQVGPGLYWMFPLVDRLVDIFRHVIGLCPPVRAKHLPLALPEASLHQNTGRPHALRHLDVHISVADDEGLVQADAEACRSLFHHSRRGLAADAFHAVLGQLGRRMVGAIVDGIELRAGILHLPIQPLVDGSNQFFGEDASTYSGLVR